MDIFRDIQDYQNFLKRLWAVLAKLQGSPLRVTPFKKGEFSLLSFCLMPNHFHLQVMQNTDVPTGKLLLRVCTSYSMYFNRKYHRVGHVFQDQYKAVPLKEDYELAAVSAYIHQNPKVAGLVTGPEDWPFSSYSDYIGIETGNVDTASLLGQFKTKRDYATFVEERYEDILELKEIES